MINEEYPDTSSLADQLECVEFIENTVGTTSDKLLDLETKISESIEITAYANDILDGLDVDLERVQDDIEGINDITENIKTAQTEIDEAEGLTNDATELMRDLERVSPEDMELENLEIRVEEYKAYDWENIGNNVDDARHRKMDLYKKYLELLDLFSRNLVF